MLFPIESCKKLCGFTYYPVLEIIVGIFFLISAFMLPILFYSYNDGFKSQQWDEWLFIAVFFVLFYFLGKNLTFQHMKVLSDSEKCQFYQNMREPSVKIETNLKSWQSLKVLNIAEDKFKKDEPMYAIILIVDNDEKEFYRSRNLKEINQMVETLKNIYIAQKGDNKNEE